jgi:hypothetical protein
MSTSDDEPSESERIRKAIIDALKEKGGSMTAKEIREKIVGPAGLDRPRKRTGYCLTKLVREGKICRESGGIYRLPPCS